MIHKNLIYATTTTICAYYIIKQMSHSFDESSKTYYDYVYNEKK